MTPKRAAKAPERRGGASRKRGQAKPGEREQQVLRLIGERPGITVPQIASELGVDATNVYGVVRRLEGKGHLRKDGMELRTAEAEPAATAEAPAGA